MKLLLSLLVGLTPAILHAGEVLRFAKSEINLRQASSLLAQTESDHQIWIVQFKGAITAADQKNLAKAGAKVYRYVPDDALVVRGSRQAIQAAFPKSLQGFLPFRGSFKLSENLPTFSVFSSNQAEIFSVTVVDGSEVAVTLAEMKKIDPSMRVLQSSGRFLDVVLQTNKVPSLASVSGIEYVELRPEIVPFSMDLLDQREVNASAAGDYSDLTGFETGTKLMNFEAAYAAGFTGAGQIVSIADTGLDKGETSTVSADFQGAVLKGYAVGVGAKMWDDPMGHGTHVAGSVAGRGTASGGKLHGGAYNAQLVPEGMWSPIIENLSVPPKLATLYKPAYDDGARIHTNSWGAARNFGAYDSMAVQTDDFLWNNPKMLILFAAGNSGVDKDRNGVIDPNSIGTPGTSKNVLTVGASKNYELKGGIQRQVKDLKAAATDWSAEPIWSSKLSELPDGKGMAMFSSRGPTADRRLKPEIVAPGTNILSTASHVQGANPLWGAYNSEYLWAGGTSMATPLTAGAAAVTREVLVKKWSMTDPSGALVKAFMIHTAYDLFPGQFGQGTPTQELQRRPNNDEGYGRVDMAKIVAAGADTKMVDEANGVGTNESKTYTVTVAQGQSLLANMVYVDAPGTASAAKALVNDLDLTLSGPNGSDQGSHDRVNNHEIIELSNLPAGTYTITVKGQNVPMGKAGKQPFALVYTVQ